jgi:hypothetical protein
MPFNHPVPRSFNLPSVREFAPPVSGVYGLSNAGSWVYIGVTDNIQAALVGHLAEAGSDLMRQRPTGFVFEICDSSRRCGRQDRLVFEYEPAFNRLGGQ